MGEREVLIEAINSDLELTQAKLRDAVNEAQELNKENENLKKYVNKAEELHAVMENLNKEKAQLIAGFEEALKGKVDRTNIDELQK